MDALDEKARRRLAASLSGDPGNRLVTTCHDTVLAYDVEQKLCRAVAELSGTCLPVRLSVTDSKARLIVTRMDGDAALGLDDSASLVIQAPSSDMRTADFEIGLHGEHFSLSHDGAYLCCEPGGRVVCDRPAVSQWERLGVRFDA
jgi:hypothetical protein